MKIQQNRIELVSRPVGHGLGVIVGDAVLVVQGNVGARARVLSHGVNLTTSREHLLPTKSKIAVNYFCILSYGTKVMSLDLVQILDQTLTPKNFF